MYNSTTNKQVVVSASQAISQGISKDGGLFVPTEIPKYSTETLQELLKMDYQNRAKKIFADFLNDFTAEEIADCVDNAYTVEKFGDKNPAPLVKVNTENAAMNVLELWHGPTSAFKDMALQILPYFLTKSMKKAHDGKQAVILVATSGDTGKAALEGFKDVDGTKIIVFYPQNGVSPMQKRQMDTQEGANVNVCSIVGNFDDAQTGVKKIFTTPEIEKTLNSNNLMFSSANSINWGRLLPQIVYYISSYCDMVNAGTIKIGDKVNIVVPTGNFGNILAAYYAMQMGISVNKFICASNKNNVLTDFINTGVYNKQRTFHTTISPSMDILVSSNLERLLYHLTNENDTQIKEWMTALKTDGAYTVTDDVKQKLSAMFYGGYCDDASTKETINEMFTKANYLCDTHTAVAINVYEKYVSETGDKATPTILASTASPYKFSKSVLEAVAPNAKLPNGEFEMVEKLQQETNVNVPAPLLAIKDKEVRFNNNCNKEAMAEFVLTSLGIN